MRTLTIVVLASVAAHAQPDRGRTLYTEHCAVCHGSAGDGGSGPDLTNPAWQAEVTDDALDRVIRDGVRGTAMPGFEDRLDTGARRAVIEHLRRMAEQAIQPTTEAQAPEIHVPVERLLNAANDPANWLHYGRDYGHQRFSPLRQITRDNVRNLVPVWSFQTGLSDGLQATPLVVDGVIYLTASWNNAFAIDARTGAEIWHYRRRFPEKMKYCCGPVNRGLAIREGLVYMATLDAHLVALDARTGRVRWDVELGRIADNLSSTGAPLVVGDKVIIGMGGGDYPSRGFLDAYNAKTGERVWRFWTIPGRGEKGVETWSGESYKTGGGATWTTGSYDPELNLVYWGIGQPWPDYEGHKREGDNLYTDCVVALEADTGKLRWYYQFTPHDVWDYDGVNEMMLVDMSFEGRPVKALLHADRNGHFYALDRTNGRFLYAKPFVRVIWATGFTPEGRPIVNPEAVTTAEGVTVCPGAAGGKEWNAMAFNPELGLAFVPVIENCAVFNYRGFRYLPGKAYGKMMAIRAATGEKVWEVKTRTPMGGGTLATAGGLVFSGDAEGNLAAYDADGGRVLWSYQTGSGMRAAPISFQIEGRQYVAIASGMGGAVRGYTGAGAPWMRNYRSGSTLYVFALFEPGLSGAFHGGARRF